MKKQPKDETKLRQELAEELRTGRLTIQQAARRMRKIVGLSQAEYAKTIGVAERTYIDFERGVGNPTLETLQKIGDRLRMRVVYFPEEGGGEGGPLEDGENPKGT